MVPCACDDTFCFGFALITLQIVWLVRIIRCQLNTLRYRMMPDFWLLIHYLMNFMCFAGQTSSQIFAIL